MKKAILMTLVLAAASAVLGETYEKGKVYAPITILGAETVTVDGHGAIIDGAGAARCATLGPNVTLKNFTFRNGRASVGGGVWGGAVVDCTIADCAAVESAAAAAHCKVSRTTITGCRVALAAAQTAALHGGIVADATLDGVTITGCRVELGTSVPGFGGIAANSALTGCTVKDNTLVVTGDHYGLLFYGGSLRDSTVMGNTVDSSLTNVAAYMKVTPEGCTLDGDTPPGPTPPDPPPGPTPPDPPPGPTPDFGPFDASSSVTYNGWLCDPKTGALVGMLQVKTTKATAGRDSKVTISVTPVGGKKKTYKTTVTPGGNPTDKYGIVYGGDGLCGAVQGLVGVPDGATVVAAKDFALAKDVRALEIPAGCRTLSLRVADGGRDSFSVTVDKKGKAKVSGLLAEGVTMSLSVTGALGADAFGVPVVYSKKITSKATGAKVQATFGFVLWISSGKTEIDSVSGGRWTDGEGDVKIGQRPAARPADGLHRISIDVPDVYLAEADDGTWLSPDGEFVKVSGKKWTTDKSVGTVKYSAAAGVYVKASKTPANLSKLKLTYTEKTGVVKGTFSLYALVSGKLKTLKATVTGVVVDGTFVGNAVVPKMGPPLEIDWK